MLTTTKKVHNSSAIDYACWRATDQGCGVSDQLDGLPTPLFDFNWCEIRRISLGSTPHRVKLRSDAHTLLIFDRGSYVSGERWMDGARLSASGPLDIGLDVLPANSEFLAMAGPGSNIGCTMISITGDEYAEASRTPLKSLSSLYPSVGLENDLLRHLANRLRQFGSIECMEGDSLYLESLCMVLFREVQLAQEHGHMAGPQRPTGGLSAWAQRTIREFLNDNDFLDQKVGLQTLADLVGVSRFHFARAFKVSFGLPPHKYLLNLRLRRAVDLLRTTSMPITDIALSVGFSCPSEFSRAFKDAMEHTPREFRQMKH